MAVTRLNVKKGDTVVVLWGKDRDRRGKVLRVFPRERKVVVEGINVVKRHTRPTRSLPQGGIIEKSNPLPVCKVMVVCPSCNKPTRVGRKLADDGTWVRHCKRCGAEIDK